MKVFEMLNSEMDPIERGRMLNGGYIIFIRYTKNKMAIEYGYLQHSGSFTEDIELAELFTKEEAISKAQDEAEKWLEASFIWGFKLWVVDAADLDVIGFSEAEKELIAFRD